MKCKFIVDIDVDVSAMDDAHKPLIRWRTNETSRTTGRIKSVPYFPAGTIYDVSAAAYFCDVGCAVPADAECEAACNPMTPEARRKLEQQYQANALGINDPEDRELFYAGVIAGYEPVGEHLAYLPGPNWESWKAAQEQSPATNGPAI